MISQFSKMLPLLLLLLLLLLQPSTSTTVSFALFPQELVSISGAEQIVKVSGLLFAEWFIPKTNSTDGDELINETNVWKPKVVMLNAASEKTIVLTPENGVTLINKEDGVLVATIWVRLFQFVCQFEMESFPSDEHESALQFMATNIGLPDPAIISNVSTNLALEGQGLFSGHSEWRLMDYRMRNNSLFANVIVFEGVFKFKRNSRYYQVMVLVPLILLTGLQILCFVVPFASGEKISCGVTVMMSFTMFLVLIDNVAPKSSDVPFLVYAIIVAMTISGISTFVNAVLLRLYHAETDEAFPTVLSKMSEIISRTFPSISRWQLYSVDEESKSGDGPVQTAAKFFETVGFWVNLILIVALLIWYAVV